MDELYTIVSCSWRLLQRTTAVVLTCGTVLYTSIVLPRQRPSDGVIWWLIEILDVTAVGYFRVVNFDGFIWRFHLTVSLDCFI